MSEQHLKIKGGIPLKGEIVAQGAKNAVTKMLVASLVSNKKCTFYNVPWIEEVALTVKLCEEIGMKVSWDKSAGIIEAITEELTSTYVSQRFSGANRIPILIMGALLGRTDEDIVVPTVGGCKIGARPVDFHIEALEKMGASIEYRKMKKDGAYFAQAHQGLRGAVIDLPYPSVGATENTILAAIRAKGTTVIKNAAIEPEIIDLILFLQKMGSHIHIDVNRTIIIEGVSEFYEVEHTVIVDKIEVASYAVAAIATKGRVFIKGATQEPLLAFLNKLREANGGFSVRRDGIEFFYQGPLKGGLHIETDVHPGFITDWQQPFVVLLTQAQGASVVHETVYENRFGYTQALCEMGADISLFHQCLGNRSCRFHSHNFNHSLVVKGATPLSGGHIAIPDLRAGFAYVLAGLIGEETSTITGLPFLDRGYEGIDHKLATLGANIERVPSGALALEEILAPKIASRV